MTGTLAAANAGASQKAPAKKGGTVKQCPKKAELSVTIVREGKPADNFYNNILVRPSAKGSNYSSKEVCDKKTHFMNVEAGSYDVSAKPRTGSGYSMKEPANVTLTAGDKKNVTVTLVANEIVEVRPNKKKCIRQYVNMKKKDDKEDWSNEVKVTARLKRKEKDVPVYWDLELGKDNGKYKDKTINGRNHRFKITTKSRTNEDGIAEATLTLGWFGGNTVRAIASLYEDPNHPNSGAKKSSEFQVWRKHYYQITYPEGATVPKRDAAAASFDKVFLASEEYDETSFKPADQTAHYRPSWQFKPGSGNTPKLNVGTHNITTFAGYYKNPTKDRKPKSHVIFSDWQFDADGVKSDWITVRFSAGDPAEKTLDCVITGQDSPAVFSPPLQGGSLLLDSSWDQQTYDTTSGTWVKTPKGALAPGDVTIKQDRTGQEEFVVKRPAGAAVNAHNVVDVFVRVAAAHGTYLGWAEDPYHVVIILNDMTAADINDTINHEIGHLFGQTPPRKDDYNNIPLHPKMYQQRGGSGTHCAEGATWHADATAAPQLDPTVMHELDAQGHGSGVYTGGTCSMFGTGQAGKRQFCEHCAAQIKARDLADFG